MKEYKVTFRDKSYKVKANDSNEAAKKVMRRLQDRLEPEQYANYGWKLTSNDFMHDIFWQAIEENVGKFTDKNAFIQTAQNRIRVLAKDLIAKTKVEFEKLVSEAFANVEKAVKEVPTAKLNWERILRK